MSLFYILQIMKICAYMISYINKVEKRVPGRYYFFRLLEEATYQIAVDS